MRILFFSFLINFTATVYAQDEIPIAGDDQILEENSDWLEDINQSLDHYLIRPKDLNQITEKELYTFPFLSALQIHQFLQYRKILGPFLEVMEIQAIPGWDVETIRRIFPFVRVMKPGNQWDHFKEGLQKNDQLILYRTNLKDFLKFNQSKFSGTSLLRYRFSSKMIEAGLQFEKDQGERWWTPSKGPPFLSGYCHIKAEGFIKDFFLGDFQMNMGQGLVLGMGRGVMKSTSAMLIKRQGSGLLPFRSTDENRFLRGAALTAGGKKVQFMFFISSNKIDGNIVRDSLNQREFISSLQTSGLHVLDAEVMDWDAIKVFSVGMKLGMKISNGNISLNHALHHFNKPMQKQSLPYNYFAMNGSRSNNMSLDFSKTIYNTHFFGEIAYGIEQSNKKAWLIGILSSLHKNVDFSIFFRNYDVGYHSYLSSALGENSEPSNEKGMYAGLSLKLSPVIQLDSYVDMFVFPWLKYRLDMPSSGKDHVTQLVWKPDKKTILTVRYKSEMKYINADMLQPLHWPEAILKTGLRTQMEHHPSLSWKWRARMEINKVQKGWKLPERGVLFFLDLFWSKPDFSINGRIMYCNTESFDSRIYAYENDVLYYGHISQFHGRFVRTYLNIQCKIIKSLTLYTKISSNLIRTEWVFRF